MIVRTGLSSFSTGISRAFSSGGGGGSTGLRIGKVFGVVTNENTPNKEQFERAGGHSGMGTIFYLDYEVSKNQTPETVDLNTCDMAILLDANIKKYPLVEELVLIVDGPSMDSQLYSGAGRKYYLSTYNLWNNTQQNKPFSTNSDKTFTEDPKIRPLEPFEGDLIIQGRKGNGLRFGSTVKLRSNINEWSNIGNDGDPITILANGYVTTDTGSSVPNVEEINKEQSSIYLTSTQVLPLQPDVTIVNPKVNTIKPNDYNSSQIILNSDRVTLNAKKDEVLLFANGNIELSTDDTINLNASETVHINSPFICLGTTPAGDYPIEPVVKGGQLSFTFDLLIGALGNLASSLATATVPTTEGGIAIPACNEAGTQLFADLKRLCDQIEKIQSDNVFTV